MRALAIILLAAWSCLSAGCYSQEPVSLAGETALAPLAPPNQARGAVLYQEKCETCHGQAGNGDGARAASLEGPKPRDFHDSVRMAGLSPSKAYLAITQGLPGTAMGDFGTLSANDRWHLAFFVMQFPHTTEAVERGRLLESSVALERSTNLLATLSNRELTAKLRQQSLPEASVSDFLAYLRVTAPFEPTPSSRARTMIAATIASYRKGEHNEAVAQAMETHLDEITVLLAVLRPRNSGLALGIDRAAREVRTLIERGALVQEIEDKAQRLSLGLSLSDPILARPPSFASGATESALLAMSYGLDGALCIFLLLILGTRKSADRRERTFVSIGILAGLTLTVALWLAWSQLAGVISGGHRAYLSLLISVSVLALGVSLLGASIHHFRSPPRTRTAASSLWLSLLLVLAPLFILRDALEILPPLVHLAGHSTGAVLGFVASGLVLVGFVGLLVTLHKRLEINGQAAMTTIAATIATLSAAGMAGQAAQNLGLLGSSPLGHSQSTWISILPTQQGILIQLIIALACTATIAFMTFRKLQIPVADSGA